MLLSGLYREKKLLVVLRAFVKLLLQNGVRDERLLPATFNNVYSRSHYMFSSLEQFEPRREKTGLRGFRPGPTQTDLYKLIKELEA